MGFVLHFQQVCKSPSIYKRCILLWETDVQIETATIKRNVLQDISDGIHEPTTKTLSPTI